MKDLFTVRNPLLWFALAVALIVTVAPGANEPTSLARTSLDQASTQCDTEYALGSSVNYDSSTSEYVCFDKTGDELGRLPAMQPVTP